MVAKWMWYTFALILVFLVLTRFEAFTSVVGSLSRAYGGSVGVLQGRTVSTSRTGTVTIGGIAR
jgi:hypothetical protein